jgi:hypothetical protein
MTKHEQVAGLIVCGAEHVWLIARESADVSYLAVI